MGPELFTRRTVEFVFHLPANSPIIPILYGDISENKKAGTNMTIYHTRENPFRHTSGTAYYLTGLEYGRKAMVLESLSGDFEASDAYAIAALVTSEEAHQKESKVQALKDAYHQADRNADLAAAALVETRNLYKAISKKRQDAWDAYQTAKKEANA